MGDFMGQNLIYDGPNVCVNDCFKTVMVQLLFPFSYCEEEIAASAMLSNMMMRTSEKYSSEDVFQLELYRHSILGMGCRVMNVGNQCFYCFSLSLVDDQSLKKNIFEEAFLFFLDSILCPNVDNQAFSSYYFDREKNGLLSAIKNNSKRMEFYCNRKVFDAVDPIGNFKNCIDNHVEQLEDLSASDLYDFYQKVVVSQVPLSFVFGNVDSEYVTSVFQKHIYKDQKAVFVDPKYNDFLPRLNDDVVCLEEHIPFSQSSLQVVYKVRDMSEQDFYLLNHVSMLLSSQSSDLLMKSLRGEGGLVYGAYSSAYVRRGFLIIRAMIYRDAREEAERRIYDVMNQLKDEKMVGPLLDLIHDRMRINLQKFLDSKSQIFGNYIEEKLGVSFHYLDDYTNSIKITATDIVSFMDRLELDLVYFFEGDRDAE